MAKDDIDVLLSIAIVFFTRGSTIFMHCEIKNIFLDKILAGINKTFMLKGLLNSYYEILPFVDSTFAFTNSCTMTNFERRSGFCNDNDELSSRKISNPFIVAKYRADRSSA